MKKLLLSTLALLSVSASAAISHDKAYGDWKGACEDGECGIVQVAYDGEKQPIGRVIVRKIGKDTVAFVTVPLGVSLKGGLGVAVDAKEIHRADYDFCDGGGCTAIFPLKNDALDKMRKGSKMQVAVFILDQSQAMEFSLKGITEALKNL